MSHTVKKYPWSMFRRPRGAKQAKAFGLRVIPPTSWDDVNFSRDAYHTVHVIKERMKGAPIPAILKRLRRYGIVSLYRFNAFK